MKEKKNSQEKDIVDRIVEQLKASTELPYEEGAWERFRKDHLGKTTRKRVIPLWVRSAAACAALAVLGLWYFHAESDLDQPTLSSTSTEQVAPSRSDKLPTPPAEEKAVIVPNLVPTQLMESYQPVYSAAPNSRLSAIHVVESWMMPTQAALVAQSVDIHNDVKLSKSKLSFLPDTDDSEVSERGDGAFPSVFADSKGVTTTAMKEVVGESKRFRFSDKFNVGLVVAPSSTDQKVNFGGGLMLSYNVTKQLSVRTGASFQQYEVGALRDPSQVASMEVAAAPERPLQNDVGLSSKSLMARVPLIPNVNSVTGMVRTIDIPVEAKYSFYKGLYAGVGVSYAAVLGQQRFAHYIENVNSNPYVAGLPSNESEMRAAVEPVVRTMESANANVNSSGFGGFVNMSVGKELKVRRGPSVSLEPYIKLPVGSFKRADMNYTNGGLRIITNF